MSIVRKKGLSLPHFVILNNGFFNIFWSNILSESVITFDEDSTFTEHFIVKGEADNEIRALLTDDVQNTFQRHQPLECE